jgi:hypothetical protein
MKGHGIISIPAYDPVAGPLTLCAEKATHHPCSVIVIPSKTLTPATLRIIGVDALSYLADEAAAKLGAVKNYIHVRGCSVASSTTGSLTEELPPCTSYGRKHPIRGSPVNFSHRNIPEQVRAMSRIQQTNPPTRSAYSARYKRDRPPESLVITPPVL